MTGPKLLCGALLLIPLAGAAGCAPVRPPVPPAKPPAETAPAPAAAPAADTALPPPSPTPEATPPPSQPSGATDVVDPGGDHGPVSLVQAAKAEKERRSHAGEPVAVITDKTLPHLPKGQLTYAAPGKKKASAVRQDGDTARDEQYWRGRAVDIRTRWRKAADEVKDLEQSAAGWRRRFYAENDPYARDSQVKPEWDRVLDRLGKARAEVDAAKKELQDFLDEGRRAGALPGWLREGAEEEPVETKKTKEPGTLEPKEPSIYKQPPESQDDHPDKPPANHGAVS